MPRAAIPKGPWSAKDNQLLYGRFHALMHKAKKRDVYFHWKTYASFLEDIIRLAPEGYIPSDFRLQFNLFGKGGYTPETLNFVPGRSKERTSGTLARSTVHQRTNESVLSRRSEDIALGVDTVLELLSDEVVF